MPEPNNIKAHETMEWILANAYTGFFIVTAPPSMQNELAIHYKTPFTAIYDYNTNVSSYSYYVLSNFAETNPEAKYLFILNMQISLETDIDMLIFNMSRDLLEKKKKAWFFFMTAETEYRLSTFAFDIYSHVLLKAHFSLTPVNETSLRLNPIVEKTVDTDKARETLERYKDIEAKLLSLPLDGTPDYQLLSAAMTLTDISELYIKCADYNKAYNIMERIKTIRVNILGTEHPDTIKSIKEIASIYTLQNK